MAQKSIALQASLLSVAVVNRARSITEYTTRLEALEKHLPRDENIIAIFRLCCRSIKQDAESLATPEECARG